MRLPRAGARGGVRRVWGAAFAVVLLALTVGPPAHAETSAENRAAAEALFKEAGRLYKAGSIEQACKALEKSQRLDPATGTLLNLARCYEKLGKLASAWIAYVDVAAQAKREGQAGREETARAAVARLGPNVPKLTIEVPEASGATNLSIKRNGKPVPRALWNVSAPVDPGSHTVEATAAGKKPWAVVVDVKVGQVQTTTVPILVDLPVAPGAAKPVQDAPSKRAPVEADSELGARKVAALVAGGVGVVAVGVGAVFGLGAKSDLDMANETCTSSVCLDREGFDHNESARDKATLATIFMGAGAALLAAGAVVWFTAPSAGAMRETARLAVGSAISPEGARLLVKGGW